MRILAIDTSASACSLAIQSGDTLHFRHEILPMQQAARILPLLEALLQTADISLQQLDAVAFGQGPGSFTGLRIAASVAKGLGFALGIPLIPVSSLAVLAQHEAERALESRYLLTAIDARMDEVYWSAFQILSSQKIKQLALERVCRPEDVSPPALNGHTWSGAGNAWQVYGQRMGYQPETIEVDGNPRARAMLFLAREAFLAGRVVSAADAAPVYLRNNVTFCKSALDSPPSRR